MPALPGQCQADAGVAPTLLCSVTCTTVQDLNQAPATAKSPFLGGGGEGETCLVGLRLDSWLCAWGSLLMGSQDYLGCRDRTPLAVCKDHCSPSLTMQRDTFVSSLVFYFIYTFEEVGFRRSVETLTGHSDFYERRALLMSDKFLERR